MNACFGCVFTNEHPCPDTNTRAPHCLHNAQPIMIKRVPRRQSNCTGWEPQLILLYSIM